MTRKLVLFSLATCIWSAAAQAPAQPQADATQTVRVERTDTLDQMRRGVRYNPDDRVCRVVPRPASRVGGRRVCRTRAEWDEISRSSREQTDDLVRDGLSANCSTRGCN